METVLVLPFWLRAIHEPIYGTKRTEILTTIVKSLNAHTDIPDNIVSNWRVENLASPPDPWRMATRQKDRIIADVSSDCMTIFINKLLNNSSHREHISVSTTATFRYEDHGLGTVEYVFQFSANNDNREQWILFLDDVSFWRTCGSKMTAEKIEAGKIPIHRIWSLIREGFERSIHKNDKCKELTKLLGQPSHGRADDFCWTYNSNVILFRNRDLPWDEEEAIAVVNIVAAAFDDRPRETSSTKFLPLARNLELWRC